MGSLPKVTRVFPAPRVTKNFLELNCLTHNHDAGTITKTETAMQAQDNGTEITTNNSKLKNTFDHDLDLDQLDKNRCHIMCIEFGSHSFNQFLVIVWEK